MGDTTLAGTEGGAHAVEGGITHGPENAIHRRLSTRLAGHHRAVRTLWHFSQDRLQMDRALPSPRASRPGGALAPAAALAESDGRGNRDGDPRRPAPPSLLGRQETPGAASQAPSPVAPPRALHRVRHPEPPRDGAYPTPAAPHGQRRAICHHDLGPALEALGLVGAPGCPPRVHRAGASRSEWAA